MTARKQGKLYDKWHRRVEGQIRHTIGQHPEWFNLKNKMVKKSFINSLAKRIVGEIVADSKLATVADDVAARPHHSEGNGDDVFRMSPSERTNGSNRSALGRPEHPR